MLRKADRKDFVKALPLYTKKASLYCEETEMLKKIIKKKYVNEELYSIVENNKVVGTCTLEREFDLSFDIAAYVSNILLTSTSNSYDVYNRLLQDISKKFEYANIIKISCNRNDLELQRAINNYFSEIVVFDLGETKEFRCRTKQSIIFDNSNSYVNVLFQQ